MLFPIFWPQLHTGNKQCVALGKRLCAIDGLKIAYHILAKRAPTILGHRLTLAQNHFLLNARNAVSPITDSRIIVGLLQINPVLNCLWLFNNRFRGILQCIRNRDSNFFYLLHLLFLRSTLLLADRLRLNSQSFLRTLTTLDKATQIECTAQQHQHHSNYTYNNPQTLATTTRRRAIQIHWVGSIFPFLCPRKGFLLHSFLSSSGFLACLLFIIRLLMNSFYGRSRGFLFSFRLGGLFFLCLFFCSPTWLYWFFIHQTGEFLRSSQCLHRNARSMRGWFRWHVFLFLGNRRQRILNDRSSFFLYIRFFLQNIPFINLFRNLVFLDGSIRKSILR